MYLHFRFFQLLILDTLSQLLLKNFCNLLSKVYHLYKLENSFPNEHWFYWISQHCIWIFRKLASQFMCRFWDNLQSSRTNSISCCKNLCCWPFCVWILIKLLISILKLRSIVNVYLNQSFENYVTILFQGEDKSVRKY